jgi:NADH-quinone oxidoreductase subunit G
MYAMLLHIDGGCVMSKNITVTIDGRTCHAKFGQTILQIARENGIYIPTMCYLTKVKPIASCRMCVVVVEGVEGMILSCQEKATNGAVIHTQNQELYKERQNIIKLYNVNHPLECGVCDKSGECDLQNKTVEFGLGEQNFTTKDVHKPVENWGFVSYDPALCIMCEKCVKVSVEITGDEALQIEEGGYASRIINVKQDKNYASLGEAAAVCPVGALVNSDFKYTTNAWELQKIPATCMHCGGGCQMTYEVKNDRIYRVTNDFEHATLCDSGRHAFDYANIDVTKDKEAFNRAIEAFKSAKSILFNSSISNEEALILQKLKERYGYKLISASAKSYQDFLSAYGSITGKSLYGGDLKKISQSQAVIVLGTRINDDSSQVKYHINMASKWNRARVIYMHPIEDVELSNIITQFIKYEVGSEEGVVALLVDTLLRDIEVPENIRAILDDLDIGNLSAESNVGEEELEVLEKSLVNKRGFSLVVGSDLYTHPQATNIAKLLALLEKYAGFSVVFVPPEGNTLGISLICELDSTIESPTIGYNVEANFTLSALGNGDLDMPSFTQQEGTTTNINKRVVPTNVALSYGGYILNDIANALGVEAEYTIDYTEQLPIEKGFKSQRFDDLPNHYDAVGNEFRGYLLTPTKVEVDEQIEEPEEIEGFDGAVIYNCNSNTIYTPMNFVRQPDDKKGLLVGSQQFATATKLKDGDRVEFALDGVEFSRLFKIDTSMKGTVALNPTYDMGLRASLLSSYRFSRLEFKKVGMEK